MQSIIYFSCTFLLCSYLQFSAARDSITSGKFNSIKNDENLISAGEKFVLGFFHYNKYVGIWYYQREPRTVVWVASKNSLPASATDRYFGITEDGNLKVWVVNGKSSNITALGNSPSSNRTVRLLDSGNLVLIDDRSRNVLWQSFDNPSDTFLPGMKMGGKLKLTSWTSIVDPSSGNYTFEQDPESENRYLIRNRSIPYWKSGRYNEIPTAVYILLRNIGTYNNSPLSWVPNYNNTRLLMNPSGQIQYFSWDDKDGEWRLIWSAPKDQAPKDQCSAYNFCGNFGICNINNRFVCKCLPGFKPTFQDSWKSKDFSGGCTRKSITCTDSTDTIFLKLGMMKVGEPDSPFKVAKSEEDCKKECRSRNCQCQAYSYTTKEGCWLWTKFLSNLQEEYSQGGHDLYVRTVTSDIRSTSRNCEPCGTNIIPYPLSTRSNCGDPDYSKFLCDYSTGQVSFQTTTGSYRVTDINPDARIFFIQSAEKNCFAIRKFEVSGPFNVTNLCYSGTNTSITDNLSQGRGEIEIKWYAPLEPACNSSSDCKDWPNSSCNERKYGTKRCHCNGNSYWSDSHLNCSEELNNPMQNKELGPKRTSLSLQAVVISVIVIVAVLLLCVFSYISYERRMAARRQESQESLQEIPMLHLYDSERRVKDLIDSGQLEEDDKKGIDVPFFELESILTATNNFSNAYKLGQGGFGPVYKVMILLSILVFIFI
ncbi:hypothetical protein F0562_010949 [Nyssa sinensis]|uniref:Receptor-like serine/threonine-protein kinase n=1 Tax=Nyssa sinensis TaxID=561372 RepID=A0A5J5A370_9ASTE|nr:hypothetical protein F0562_010949 [Nyssa sinensis]